MCRWSEEMCQAGANTCQRMTRCCTSAVVLESLLQLQLRSGLDSLPPVSDISGLDTSKLATVVLMGNITCQTCEKRC